MHPPRLRRCSPRRDGSVEVVTRAGIHLDLVRGAHGLDDGFETPRRRRANGDIALASQDQQGELLAFQSERMRSRFLSLLAPVKVP